MHHTCSHFGDTNILMRFLGLELLLFFNETEWCGGQFECCLRTVHAVRGAWSQQGCPTRSRAEMRAEVELSGTSTIVGATTSSDSLS
jgi:hypothetical protein